MTVVWTWYWRELSNLLPQNDQGCIIWHVWPEGNVGLNLLLDIKLDSGHSKPAGLNNAVFVFLDIVKELGA